MKDMFDCLEEVGVDLLRENVYIVKRVKNKRRQTRKIYYLETISQLGETTWTLNQENAIRLNPEKFTYEILKEGIRKYKIKCQIFRIPKPIIEKPVRKNWWGKVKVWFSRRIKEFMTIPVDSSLP